jgi:hypothetical protein
LQQLALVNKIVVYPSGRDEEAGLLVALLQNQLSTKGSPCKAAVCVVAGAGMGKSCLSLDAGWRLAKAGACPGVDFSREVYTKLILPLNFP